MVPTLLFPSGDQDGHLGEGVDEVVDVDAIELVMAFQVTGVRCGGVVYTRVYPCQPLWRAFSWMHRRFHLPPYPAEGLGIYEPLKGGVANAKLTGSLST